MFWFRRSASQRQAERLAKALQSELTRLKVSARDSKGDLMRVQWLEPLVLTRNELWLPIDQQNMPTGITMADLRREDIVDSLSEAVGKAVRVDKLPTGKMCYVVRLAGKDFPVSFPQANFKLPDDAPALAFPLGIDANGDHRWLDLAELPHLLSVGSTNNGKSNFAHLMLTTWIQRNTADSLKLWICDHKGGVELFPYTRLKGKTGSPGVVHRFSSQPRQTVELLESAFREVERRLELLRQAGAVDLVDYEQRTGATMPRIVLFIDELYFLMLSKEPIDSDIASNRKYTIANWSEELLGKIASSGRAPGVHMVIFTQRTGQDVLSGIVTANFESRLIFSLAGMHQGVALINSGVATAMPQGRAVFRSPIARGGLEMVQTPRITPGEVTRVITRVARYGPNGGLGRNNELRRFVEDAQLLLTASCSELDGVFSRDKLLRLESIRGAVTHERFNDIAQRLQRDGILTSGGPKKPRRVAAGYMHRADLLPAFYGLDAAKSDQTVAPVVPGNNPASTYGLQQQDAPKDAPTQAVDTVYSSENSAESTDDLPLPELFKQAIDDIQRGDKNS